MKIILSNIIEVFHAHGGFMFLRRGLLFGKGCSRL